MTHRSGEQFHNLGTTGEEEVHALVVANVVCRLGAPMQALVAQGANCPVDGIGKVDIDQAYPRPSSRVLPGRGQVEVLQ